MLSISRVNTNINNYTDNLARRDNSSPYVMPKSISFGYDSPLKNIAKHCAYCGKEMLTEQEAESLASKILLLSGSKLQQNLLTLIKLLGNSPNTQAQKEIIRDIFKLSNQHKNQTGRLLLYNYINEKRVNFTEEINMDDAEKKELYAKLERLKPDQPQFTQQLIDRLINEINPSRLITIYNEIKVIRNKTEKEGLELSQDFKDFCEGFSIKFEELKKDKAINIAVTNDVVTLLKNCIAPVKISMEHIHPHSKKGKDHTYNYLATCTDCNSERGNEDFIKYLTRNPQIKVFIRKSLQEVKTLMANLSKIPEEMANYIQEVCKTLKKESNGKLDLQM